MQSHLPKVLTVCKWRAAAVGPRPWGISVPSCGLACEQFVAAVRPANRSVRSRREGRAADGCGRHVAGVGRVIEYCGLERLLSDDGSHKAAHRVE